MLICHLGATRICIMNEGKQPAYRKMDVSPFHSDLKCEKMRGVPASPASVLSAPRSSSRRG